MNTSNPDERVRPLDMAKVAAALGAVPAGGDPVVRSNNPFGRMLTGMARHQQMRETHLINVDLEEHDRQ